MRHPNVEDVAPFFRMAASQSVLSSSERPLRRPVRSRSSRRHNSGVPLALKCDATHIVASHRRRKEKYPFYWVGIPRVFDTPPLEQRLLKSDEGVLNEENVSLLGMLTWCAAAGAAAEERFVRVRESVPGEYIVVLRADAPPPASERNIIESHGAKLGGIYTEVIDTQTSQAWIDWANHADRGHLIWYHVFEPCWEHLGGII